MPKVGRQKFKSVKKIDSGGIWSWTKITPGVAVSLQTVLNDLATKVQLNDVVGHDSDQPQSLPIDSGRLR